MNKINKLSIFYNNNGGWYKHNVDDIIAFKVCCFLPECYILDSHTLRSNYFYHWIQAISPKSSVLHIISKRVIKRNNFYSWGYTIADPPLKYMYLKYIMDSWNSVRALLLNIRYESIYNHYTI